ncbi:MAG: recombinase family protein [Paraglaciecola sp.]|uniref:recombinase family protein n=1 Tax=Paraglaciecola sp. TaxID=1920173 RepID=UPI00326513FF
MKATTPQIAVAYARVSSLKQVKEGSGASSQIARCEMYAKTIGLEVVKTFTDEGVSGSLVERPRMDAMLSFVKKQKDGCVIIIDDISRLARGISAHVELRAMIEAAGGTLMSPSVEFGSTSDELLVENMLATVAQHFRDKNRETVINRTMARLKRGYSTVSIPSVGYRYERSHEHGKLLVRDEPMATIVKTVLDGFACGRFESQTDVKRYLDKQDAFPKGKNGVYLQQVNKILTNILYAGYLHFPHRDINMVPAKHEALIEYDTYLAIQARLKGEAKAPARTEIATEFPLRGFVACSSCGEAMTSSKPKGRNKYYSYYHCHKKHCELYGKSFSSDKVEGEFETLLRRLRPSQSLFHLTKRTCEMQWENRGILKDANIDALKKERNGLDNKIETLVTRILETQSPSLINVYENSVKELEFKKVELDEKIASSHENLPDFENCFGTAFEFLANPYERWCSEYDDKRVVLRLAFTERMPYDPHNGFVGTAPIAQPFRLVEQLGMSNYEVVELAGVELLISIL